MDGEVLHRHRGGDVPNVDELLLTDAGRRAAHVLGLSVQSEKLWKTHTQARTRKRQAESASGGEYLGFHTCTKRWLGVVPGHGESSQCLM